MSRSRYVLSRRSSFWVSAGVVCHGLWTSAAPALVYPLYAAEWHLTHTVTTAIFAVYPIVVVGVLIVFGELSDFIGRRRTMLLGLAASLFGVFLFALAPNVLWLFAGRAFMGLGVGLSASPSTAALVDFSDPGETKRASSVTTAAQAIGFACALLLGGALIEYAPFPARLTFWVLFAVLVLLFIATWFLPDRSLNSTQSRWRFRIPSVPIGLRKTFAISALAITTGYTHGVMILSLGAQVAHDLVGSSNAFVNGAALSLWAIFSGVAGILARPLQSRISILAGALASAASMGILALSIINHDLPSFLAATATAGVAYALLFLGGLEVINAAAPAARRGGVLSAIYLFAYLSLGVTALTLGVIATKWGLQFAVEIGAGVIALMSAATIGLASLLPAARPPERDAPKDAVACRFP